VRCFLRAVARAQCRRDRERLILARAAQAEKEGFAKVLRALEQAERE
jgi:hypothetical protein